MGDGIGIERIAQDGVGHLDVWRDVEADSGDTAGRDFRQRAALPVCDIAGWTRLTERVMKSLAGTMMRSSQAALPD